MYDDSTADVVGLPSTGFAEQLQTIGSFTSVTVALLAIVVVALLLGVAMRRFNLS